MEIFNFFGQRTQPPCTDWGEISHGQAHPRAARPCETSRKSVKRVIALSTSKWDHRSPVVLYVSSVNCADL